MAYTQHEYNQSVIEFAEYLNIDPSEDFDLLWIAEEAMQAALPRSWQECTDDDGNVFYYNENTQESSWEHPLDSYYRQLVQKEKSKARSRRDQLLSQYDEPDPPPKQKEDWDELHQNFQKDFVAQKVKAKLKEKKRAKKRAKLEYLAATLIQAVWRGHAVRQEVGPTLQRRRSAAVKIQAAVREWLIRKRQNELMEMHREEAACRVQRSYNSYRARKRARAARRAQIERRNLAAQVIQRAWRSYKQRCAEDGVAATVLQRWWRRHLRRQKAETNRLRRESEARRLAAKTAALRQAHAPEASNSTTLQSPATEPEVPAPASPAEASAEDTPTPKAPTKAPSLTITTTAMETTSAVPAHAVVDGPGKRLGPSTDARAGVCVDGASRPGSPPDSTRALLGTPPDSARAQVPTPLDSARIIDTSVTEDPEPSSTAAVDPKADAQPISPEVSASASVPSVPSIPPTTSPGPVASVDSAHPSQPEGSGTAAVPLPEATDPVKLPEKAIARPTDAPKTGSHTLPTGTPGGSTDRTVGALTQSALHGSLRSVKVENMRKKVESQSSSTDVVGGTVDDILFQTRLQRERDDAAVRIQTMYRGYHARHVAVPAERHRQTRLRHLKECGAARRVQRAYRLHYGRRNVAALRIQRVFRGYYARVLMARAERERLLALIETIAAIYIQAVWRGYSTRKRILPLLNKHKRTAVVVQGVKSRLMVPVLKTRFRRNHAAKTIQRQYRMRTGHMRHIVKQHKAIRSAAAIIIQRAWRAAGARLAARKNRLIASVRNSLASFSRSAVGVGPGGSVGGVAGARAGHGVTQDSRGTLAPMPPHLPPASSSAVAALAAAVPNTSHGARPSIPTATRPAAREGRKASSRRPRPIALQITEVEAYLNVRPIWPVVPRTIARSQYPLKKSVAERLDRHKSMAQFFFNRSRLTGALSHLEQVLDSDPRYIDRLYLAEAYLQYAAILCKMSKHEASIRHTLQVLQLLRTDTSLTTGHAAGPSPAWKKMQKDTASRMQAPRGPLNKSKLHSSKGQDGSHRVKFADATPGGGGGTGRLNGSDDNRVGAWTPAHDDQQFDKEHFLTTTDPHDWADESTGMRGEGGEVASGGVGVESGQSRISGRTQTPRLIAAGADQPSARGDTADSKERSNHAVNLKRQASMEVSEGSPTPSSAHISTGSSGDGSQNCQHEKGMHNPVALPPRANGLPPRTLPASVLGEPTRSSCGMQQRRDGTYSAPTVKFQMPSGDVFSPSHPNAGSGIHTPVDSSAGEMRVSRPDSGSVVESNGVSLSNTGNHEVTKSSIRSRRSSLSLTACQSPLQATSRPGTEGRFSASLRSLATSLALEETVATTFQNLLDTVEDTLLHDTEEVAVDFCKDLVDRVCTLLDRASTSGSNAPTHVSEYDCLRAVTDVWDASVELARSTSAQNSLAQTATSLLSEGDVSPSPLRGTAKSVTFDDDSGDRSPRHNRNKGDDEPLLAKAIANCATETPATNDGVSGDATIDMASPGSPKPNASKESPTCSRASFRESKGIDKPRSVLFTSPSPNSPSPVMRVREVSRGSSIRSFSAGSGGSVRFGSRGSKSKRLGVSVPAKALRSPPPPESSLAGSILKRHMDQSPAIESGSPLFPVMNTFMSAVMGAASPQLSVSEACGQTSYSPPPAVREVSPEMEGEGTSRGVCGKAEQVGSDSSDDENNETERRVGDAEGDMDIASILRSLREGSSPKRRRKPKRTVTWDTCVKMWRHVCIAIAHHNIAVQLLCLGDSMGRSLGLPFSRSATADALPEELSPKRPLAAGFLEDRVDSVGASEDPLPQMLSSPPPHHQHHHHHSQTKGGKRRGGAWDAWQWAEWHCFRALSYARHALPPAHPIHKQVATTYLSCLRVFGVTPSAAVLNGIDPIVVHRTGALFTTLQEAIGAPAKPRKLPHVPPSQIAGFRSRHSPYPPASLGDRRVTKRTKLQKASGARHGLGLGQGQTFTRLYEQSKVDPVVRDVQRTNTVRLGKHNLAQDSPIHEKLKEAIARPTGDSFSRHSPTKKKLRFTPDPLSPDRWGEGQDEDHGGYGLDEFSQYAAVSSATEKLERQRKQMVEWQEAQARYQQQWLMYYQQQFEQMHAAQPGSASAVTAQLHSQSPVEANLRATEPVTAASAGAPVAVGIGGAPGPAAAANEAEPASGLFPMTSVNPYEYYQQWMAAYAQQAMPYYGYPPSHGGGALPPVHSATSRSQSALGYHHHLHQSGPPGDASSASSHPPRSVSAMGHLGGDYHRAPDDESRYPSGMGQGHNRHTRAWEGTSQPNGTGNHQHLTSYDEAGMRLNPAIARADMYRRDQQMKLQAMGEVASAPVKSQSPNFSHHRMASRPWAGEGEGSAVSSTGSIPRQATEKGLSPLNVGKRGVNGHRQDDRPPRLAKASKPTWKMQQSKPRQNDRAHPTAMQRPGALARSEAPLPLPASEKVAGESNVLVRETQSSSHSDGPREGDARSSASGSARSFCESVAESVRSGTTGRRVTAAAGSDMNSVRSGRSLDESLAESLGESVAESVGESVGGTVHEFPADAESVHSGSRQPHSRGSAQTSIVDSVVESIPEDV